ncbi:MAG: carboxypeptidase-like regulatory domain-containing protein, partial [Bacteroidetes bacterium]|nr:carboxypeptidase-like regulatory domain-containing protein [Bacteroidota bacterium]
MEQKQLISFKNVHCPLFSFKLKLSSFLFFMTLFSVLAQGYSQVRITGNISDSNGNPLIGASVVEKGTNNGTQSDFDGNFLIENVKNDGTVIFSYIGFKSIEVSVIGKSTINAVLTEALNNLDEVVLIGYGSQRKSDLTGAVGSVKTSQL